MDKRIVYEYGSGVAVITPVDISISLDEIARKDVPAGVPYLIVDASDIPSDRSYREAWIADFSTPHGYGIGPDAWFAEQAAAAAAQEDSQ